jgi:hypothetical protein
MDLKEIVYPNLGAPKENNRFLFLYHSKMTGVFLKHQTFYEMRTYERFYETMILGYREGYAIAVCLMVD